MAKGAPRTLAKAKPATATRKGLFLQMPVQAPAAGANPTKAEFDALLTKLKNAGLMASA